MQDIVAKYLIKNILAIFFAIFFVIAILIIGNIFTLVLKSTLDQNLDISSLLSLVLIKSLRDIPLIINLSFFMAIIATLGKMSKDSEMTAINSLGIGDFRIILKIMPLIIAVATIVFVISMFLVPYSNVVKEIIIQKNANTSEFHLIKTRQFQKFAGENIVLYAGGSDKNTLGNIFIYTKKNNDKNIILAEDGYRYQDDSENVYIRLKNGSRYSGFLEQDDKKIIYFDSLDVKLIEGGRATKTLKANTDGKSLSQLLNDPSSVNIAEIWWRISLPLSLLIISFIGVLLSKSPLRGGKNLGILYGVVIFAIYLNMLKIYKDKIVDDEIDLLSSTIPHLLFIVITIVIYLYQGNYFTKFDKKLRSIINERI